MKISGLTDLASPFDSTVSLPVGPPPLPPIFTSVLVELLDVATSTYWCYVPVAGTYTLDPELIRRLRVPAPSSQESPNSIRYAFEVGRFLLTLSGTGVSVDIFC